MYRSARISSRQRPVEVGAVEARESRCLQHCNTAKMENYSNATARSLKAVASAKSAGKEAGYTRYPWLRARLRVSARPKCARSAGAAPAHGSSSPHKCGSFLVLTRGHRRQCRDGHPSARSARASQARTSALLNRPRTRSFLGSHCHRRSRWCCETSASSGCCASRCAPCAGPCA